MRSILKAGLLGAVILFLAVSCGGEKGAAGVGAGQVSVSLTDDNDCGITSVFVTITKVRVHKSATALDTDAGWIDIIPSGGPLKIDLLSLQNGTLQDLGLASLPVGHYTQIRFFLAQNTGVTPASNDNDFVVTGGNSFPLDIPSGFQSGIKVIKPFDVSAGQTTVIIADFDACNSVTQTTDGDYILRPRILPLLKSEAGSITGVVNPVPGIGAVAKAEVKGADGNFSVARQTLVDPVTGSFTLFPLLNSIDLNTDFPVTGGTYDVVIVSSVTATSVTTGVPVTAGSETAISNAGNKTPLASSLLNNETVNVIIDPTSADARIRQAVNGNVYQVRRRQVRLFDGETSFLLALASPTFGAFPALPTTTGAPLSLGSLTVDTPSDDGFYADSVQNIPISSGSTQTMTFTGAGELALLGGATPGTANGHITVNSAPVFPVTIVLSVRTTDTFENVNSTAVTVKAALTAFPYTIDDLPPGTYILDIVFSNGLTIFSPARSVPITVTGGGTVSKDFIISP